jgi:hypothetical protein
MAALIALPVLMVPAQSVEGEGLWSPRVTSPSYGLNFAFLEVTHGENDDTSTYVMPGFDLRHFNGINVTESGRFYFGYEVGVAGNFFAGGEPSYEAFGEDYTLTSAMGVTALLMGKHGYRRDIGSADGGLGVGVELGLGLMGGMGDLEFTADDEDETVYSQDTEIISPVFELAGEFSIRTERDLRFMTRLGILAGAQIIDVSDGETGVTGLSGEAAPVRVSLRFGFVRDYAREY